MADRERKGDLLEDISLPVPSTPTGTTILIKEFVFVGSSVNSVPQSSTTRDVGRVGPLLIWESCVSSTHAILDSRFIVAAANSVLLGSTVLVDLSAMNGVNINRTTTVIAGEWSEFTENKQVELLHLSIVSSVA